MTRVFKYFSAHAWDWKETVVVRTQKTSYKTNKMQVSSYHLSFSKNKRATDVVGMMVFCPATAMSLVEIACYVLENAAMLDCLRLETNLGLPRCSTNKLGKCLTMEDDMIRNPRHRPWLWKHSSRAKFHLQLNWTFWGHVSCANPWSSNCFSPIL